METAFASEGAGSGNRRENTDEVRIDIQNPNGSSKLARSPLSAGDGLRNDVGSSSGPMISVALIPRLRQPPRWGKPEEAGYGHQPRGCRNFLNWRVMEILLFIVTFTTFIVITATPAFRTLNVLSIRAWRWVILATAAFCGRLIIKLIVKIVIIIIKTHNICSTTCLYYIYKTRKTTILIIWFTASLITWCLIFNGSVDKTPKKEKIREYVIWALVRLILFANFWLAKIILAKKLVVNRYKKIYFERLKSALFFQYLLETFLSPPPNKITKELVFEAKIPKKKGSVELYEKLTVAEWRTVITDNVSPLTLKNFIHFVQHTRLHELLDEILQHKTLTSVESQRDLQARLISEEVFTRISGDGLEISQSDIERYMTSEFAEMTFGLIPKSPNCNISRTDFNNWQVRGFNERAYLELSLSDTAQILKPVHYLLNKMVWALMWMGLLGLFKNIGTIKFIVLLLSHVAVLTYALLDTVKNALLCLKLLFWHRPFDVGDQVTVDGITMVVEEMKLQTTIFRSRNGDRIIRANSEIAPDTVRNRISTA